MRRRGRTGLTRGGNVGHNVGMNIVCYVLYYVKNLWGEIVSGFRYEEEISRYDIEMMIGGPDFTERHVHQYMGRNGKTFNETEWVE